MTIEGVGRLLMSKLVSSASLTPPLLVFANTQRVNKLKTAVVRYLTGNSAYITTVALDDEVSC